MSLTTAQQVRLRIADPWRYAQEVRAGDGTASAFKLAQGAPHSTISAASALVATTAGWSSTGATFETAFGLATFSGVISAQSAWMAAYQWAVFSEEEVGNFITAGGSTVLGASLEACLALMFDGVKRAKWSAPDGSDYDDTAALKHLNDLYDRLKEESDIGEFAASGGIESWGEQQAYFTNEYPSAVE